MSKDLQRERDEFEAGEVWVVKIGSSLLTRNGQGLATDHISDWVAQIAELHKAGKQIVLVSSGAVAEGMTRLGLKKRPGSIQLLQAAAAVGQMGLIQAYESNFQKYGLHTAQVLLTHDDLRSRERYINARGTLKNLLELGVIPVVNENDTVVTDEIRFGDNDSLAALVANLISANTLLLLTDQTGLFNADPRKTQSAKFIAVMEANDSSLNQMAGAGSTLGRGGMVTKIEAARIASRSGANTIIASGLESRIILRIAQGEVVGSLLVANQEVLVSRKQWLAALPTAGEVTIDAGAVRVLREQGRSLLPVGAKSVNREFTRGEMVSCIDEAGDEIARGLINYSNVETTAICGRSSSEIESILGYAGEEELIHRDNLVIV
ncbi:MAG: glutamate 5-kinase [bacterium]|nr:glutamate 5-kinase [Gammaproteobacteria bacterium]HIL95193.1 glutamate 5-kinase [Pseudomonadales bacterium]